MVTASDVDVAVVDVTAPTGSVTLAAGGSGSIAINISVSGNQAGTATFQVYRTWMLSGGLFTGSNPQQFVVGPRAGGDPATTFTTTGTVTVAAGQAPGSWVLAVGAFDITNSNTSGGKLAARNASSYTVNVLPPPSDTTPPVITPSVIGTLGNDDWYTSDVTVGWSVVDGESPISASSGCASTTITTDTVGTTFTCSATSTGGTSTDSVTIKRDATAPSISAALDGDPAASGWFNIVTGAPTVEFTCADATSGVSSCPSDHLFGEGENQSHSATAYDAAGNSASAGVSDVDVDLTAPSISAALDGDPAASGWFNIVTGAPTVEFTCTDATSGVSSCPADHLFDEGENQSHSATAYDAAGNSASAGVSDVDVDLTAPSIAWNGGPADAGSYYFGSVPSEPTCTAADDLSGPNGCEVGGYADAVGSHVVSATAADVAGNTSTDMRDYSVLAWTLTGFYQPVDMNGTWNTVKGGSTVPFKFEVFVGTTERTDVAAIKSFSAVATACPNGALTTDLIEFTTTGGTSVRYDAVAGQFVQNWQTPKKPGTCWSVTMTTQDGSTLVAKFMLK